MKQEKIEEIKKQVLPILQSAEVSRAAIFGSYVRGEQRNDSDIDIVVDFPSGMSLFDVIGLKLQLEESTGKKIDLVGYKTMKPRIKERVFEEQIKIL